MFSNGPSTLNQRALTRFGALSVYLGFGCSGLGSGLSGLALEVQVNPFGGVRALPWDVLRLCQFAGGF